LPWRKVFCIGNSIIIAQLIDKFLCAWRCRYTQKEGKEDKVVGEYSGEFNSNGHRHGSGFMQFQDGTTENGPWFNDDIAPAEKQRRARLSKAKAEVNKLDALLSAKEVTEAPADATKQKLVTDVFAAREALQTYINGGAEHALTTALLTADVLALRAQTEQHSREGVLARIV